MIFILLIIIYCFIIVFLAIFFLSFFFGAPYIRTKPQLRNRLWYFADLKKGDIVLDIGSGDGIILRTLAKQGVQGIGWEIHPMLVIWSQLLNFLSGYGKNITVEHKNVWKHVLPKKVDMVVIYGMGYMFKKLLKKMQKELNPGTKVVSIRFQIPDLTPIKQEKELFLYIL